MAGLVAQGLSNEEIAERIFIHPGTVCRHLHNCYSAMGYEQARGGVERVKLTLDYWRSYGT